MDRDFEITTGPDGLPTQTFNGKTYKKRINEDKEWFSEFHKKGIASEDDDDGNNVSDVQKSNKSTVAPAKPTNSTTTSTSQNTR